MMNKDELQTLKALMRGEIERKVGYPLQSGPDLARLAKMILAETREYVSATTLKRFWDLYEGNIRRARASGMRWQSLSAMPISPLSAAV